MDKKAGATTKKNYSDFEQLKVWQDNPDLLYYLSDNHWNHHVNLLLYAYLTSRYKGNEVGVYINLALCNGEAAFKIDYNSIYGVMFNEAYCFCSYVLNTPVPETKIGFLENKAESLCPDDAKLAKPIVAYNILVMTGLILCFANEQNNNVGRFLSFLSRYNHTNYFGDEYHHFEDYIKTGVECVAGIMIDGQLRPPGKLRPGYDYKGHDEYLRKTILWYRVSVEKVEKRVEKPSNKTNEMESVLSQKINEVLNKVEEQAEMIRKLERRSYSHHQQRRSDFWAQAMKYIDTSSLNKQTINTDQQDSLLPSSSEETFSQLAPHENKQSRPRGRKPKKFEDFVHNDAPEGLIPVLEEMMNNTSGRDALAIILSIKGLYIDMPTNKSVCERFNTVRETAYGEAMARHKGTTYGKNDFSKKPDPIPETELTRIRDRINEKIKAKEGR